jgi:hypothetical protein
VIMGHRKPGLVAMLQFVHRLVSECKVTRKAARVKDGVSDREHYVWF